MVPDDKQLRLRTIAHGNSTIRFSLIYADISVGNSFIGKLLEGIGEAIIGKLTGGISSLILMEGTKVAASYNLERLVESASGGKQAKYILGRGGLEFNDRMEGKKAISLKADNGQEIVELNINIT